MVPPVKSVNEAENEPLVADPLALLAPESEASVPQTKPVAVTEAPPSAATVPFSVAVVSAKSDAAELVTDGVLAELGVSSLKQRTENPYRRPLSYRSTLSLPELRKRLHAPDVPPGEALHQTP